MGAGVGAGEGVVTGPTVNDPLMIEACGSHLKVYVPAVSVIVNASFAPTLPVRTGLSARAPPAAPSAETSKMTPSVSPRTPLLRRIVPAGLLTRAK